MKQPVNQQDSTGPNPAPKGFYIVLEGAQGVGKSTQTAKLAAALRAYNLPVQVFKEPDSQCDETTKIISQVTQNPRYPMNSRTEVLLYNALRSQSLKHIEAARNNGFICIVDRSYLTTFVMQYYGRGDLPDYYAISNVVDFAIGDIRPDLIIVLDAPVTALIERKQQIEQTDRFDRLDSSVLERVRAGFLWEAKQRQLPVVHANGSIDDVFNDVWTHVSVLLNIDAGEDKQPTSFATSIADIMSTAPVKPTNSTNMPQISNKPDVKSQAVLRTNLQTDEPTIPTGLTDSQLHSYNQAISKLLANQKALAERVAERIAKQPAKTTPEETSTAKERALNCLLPLASFSQYAEFSGKQPEPTKTLNEYLPKTYDSSTERLVLLDSTPKNELSLTAKIMFLVSNCDYRQTQHSLMTAPYGVKAQILEDYVRSTDNDHMLLYEVKYTWALATSYSTLAALGTISGQKAILTQKATPLLGYHTPAIIEELGLADEYDECFDESLAFHSQLEAASAPQAAELVVLSGHTLRWVLNLNRVELMELVRVAELLPKEDELRSLVQGLAASTESVHPLLGEYTAAA